MNPPRFLLVLAVQENLLRASLVTRDLKIASSAKQSFHVDENAGAVRQFDPAQVWYKMKKVIAACFDIGRTQPRELLACALVDDGRAWCVWQANAGDVNSVGYGSDANVPLPNTFAIPAGFREHDAPVLGGTAGAWLLWNLSGAYVLPGAELPAWRTRAGGCELPVSEPRPCDDSAAACFGMIRARSPFAETLPIVSVFSGMELVGQGDVSPDETIRRAAARAYGQLNPAHKSDRAGFLT